jgi:hypothetical protein
MRLQDKVPSGVQGRSPGRGSRSREFQASARSRKLVSTRAIGSPKEAAGH